MTEILNINDVRIQKCQSPLMKKVSAVVDDTNMLSVLCPEGTSDEEVITYVRMNFPNFIFGKEEQTSEDSLDSGINEESVLEQKTYVSALKETQWNQPTTEWKRSKQKTKWIDGNTILKITIDNSLNKIECISYRQNGKKLEIQVRMPEGIDECRIRFFVRCIKSDLYYRSRTKRFTNNVCRTGFVDVVEGYKVLFRTPKKDYQTLFGEVVHDRNVVFINVNGPDEECSRESIIAYVRQQLDEILQRDYDHTMSFTGRSENKQNLVFSGFSHVNRRSDIIDDEPVKVMKHKLKTSVISPTYSSPLSGEKTRPIEGMPVITHDGRLVSYEKVEEKFREQD